MENTNYKEIFSRLDDETKTDIIMRYLVDRGIEENLKKTIFGAEFRPGNGAVTLCFWIPLDRLIGLFGEGFAPPTADKELENLESMIHEELRDTDLKVLSLNFYKSITDSKCIDEFYVDPDLLGEFTLDEIHARLFSDIEILETIIRNHFEVVPVAYTLKLKTKE